MKEDRKIALFFGTFNPVHVGHLIIATWVLNNVDEVKEVWFVVSPRSPFKERMALIPFEERILMLETVCRKVKGLKVCDVEGHLPVPSYTWRTLQKIGELFPDERFALLVGSDTYISMPLWKNASWILSNFPIYVYPRGHRGTEMPVLSDKTSFLEAPLIEVSSTMVREWLRQGKIPHFFVPEEVLSLILRKGFCQ